MLVDRFGRTIDYIRISVTDRCNFRCQYCMPDTPEDFFDDKDDVPLEQLLELMRVAIDEGVKKIRITGGEPLIRHDLDMFIAGISEYGEHVDIALTTNGFYLKNYAKRLKDAGLRRINVSLDSLRPEVVQLISKKNVLPQILEGIDIALDVGLGVKLNMVPIKGVNDCEIPDLINFARSKRILIRFIEFMENSHAKAGAVGLRQAEILELIGRYFVFRKIEKEMFGPATLYEIESGGAFGIIAPHNDDFCESCNRVRISSDGKIIPCLYFEDAVDARVAMASGDRELMKKALLQAVVNKPEKNEWREEGNQTSNRAFYKTGG
ncbi:MAG: GTP 3',8-cyclase MoaA [Wolinella sp.]